MLKDKLTDVKKQKYQRPKLMQIEIEYNDVIATSLCLHDCPVHGHNNLSKDIYSGT